MSHFIKEQFKHWFYTLQTAGSQSAFTPRYPCPKAQCAHTWPSIREGKGKGLTSRIYHGGDTKRLLLGAEEVMKSGDSMWSKDVFIPTAPA